MRRFQPVLLLALSSFLACAAETPPTHVVDIGSPDDETYVVEGFHGREGPVPASQMEIPKNGTFRWAGNSFVLRIPVVPQRHNELTFRMQIKGSVRMSVGDRWSKVVPGMDAGRLRYAVVIPKAVVGDAKLVQLKCAAVRPVEPPADEKRTLFALIDRIEVRPVDELPGERERALLESTRDIPVLDRIRGIERRPFVSDADGFVEQLVEENANIVTLGTMNGLGYLFYPSKFGTVHPRMDPDYLPAVIRKLRENHIGVLCWVVFNVQDVRNVDDFVIAKSHPEWKIEYIGPTDPKRPRVGMCVVSSPYVQHHVEVLKECAAFDIDGFFFDGFYLGGIPHPAQPGCTCTFCKERFKADTGLELPAKVDWTDGTFKRWVRWRNQRLLDVARYFQAEMRKVNPKATCTFNFNLWPFGNKDWETAIPAWRIDDFGVSQHGYTATFEQKWMMLGFKCRLGRDLNPQHTDVWRSAGYNTTCGVKGEPDLAWHELELTTHILSGLSHGITPWHSTIEGPIELTARIHREVARRERYFSRKHIANVRVFYSQNTHDFYGHIPETSHLSDYRDLLIGNWMLLSENHVPFEFCFDNQIEEGVPEGTKVLVLPNTAALSEKMAAHLAAWVKDGGRLIATQETGCYDEWGERLKGNRLTNALGLGDLWPTEAKRVGKGDVVYLAVDPGGAWSRERNEASAKRVLELFRKDQLPFVVEAPKTLVVNLFEGQAPGELWVHLLNVSPWMPGGDSGFRGMGRPAEAKDVGSDAQLVLKSGKRGIGPLVPARNVVLRLNGYTVESARLAVAETPLTVKDGCEIMVPEVGLHDVVVLKVQSHPPMRP